MKAISHSIASQLAILQTSAIDWAQLRYTRAHRWPTGSRWAYLYLEVAPSFLEYLGDEVAFKHCSCDHDTYIPDSAEDLDSRDVNLRSDITFCRPLLPI